MIAETIRSSIKKQDEIVKFWRNTFNFLFGKRVAYNGVEYIIIHLFPKEVSRKKYTMTYEPYLLLANDFETTKEMPLNYYLKMERKNYETRTKEL